MPRWETWEKVHTPGAYMWKKVLGWVSLHLGGPGVGDPSNGNFERWMKRAPGMGRLSLYRLTAEGLEGGLLYWVLWVMN